MVLGVVRSKFWSDAGAAEPAEPSRKPAGGKGGRGTCNGGTKLAEGSAWAAVAAGATGGLAGVMVTADVVGDGIAGATITGALELAGDGADAGGTAA